MSQGCNGQTLEVAHSDKIPMAVEDSVSGTKRIKGYHML